MKLNDAGPRPPVFFWLVAWLLVLFVAGCGGGGGDTGSGILIFSTDSAPGAPGTQLPGTGTTSGPSVPSASPGNGATQVPVSTVQANNALLPRTISATFSEAMNPASLVSPALALTLKETISGVAVAGHVSLNAANTVATFTPAAPLAPNTQFTAILTTAATTAAGTALSKGYGWSFTTGTQIGQSPLNLGTAANFLVLGGTQIANTSTGALPTRVNGQLGIDPGTPSSVTGFTDSTPTGTGLILTGGIQSGPLVTQATTDFLAARNEAATRSSQQVVMGSSELALFTVNGGSPGVYPPGLYTSASTLTLTSGNMTLDAGGDPEAVWVFKAGSSLTVGDTRQMLLLNGAQASRVFWALGSSALIGDLVNFKGTLLAGSSCTLGTAAASGTRLEGRVLSLAGLDLNYASIHAP
jgi:hypothetical protein